MLQLWLRKERECDKRRPELIRVVQDLKKKFAKIIGMTTANY